LSWCGAKQREEQDKRRRKELKSRLTKKAAKVLFDSLKVSASEKDVENAWRKIFVQYYIDNGKEDYQISSENNVDGFIYTNSGSILFALKILLEFKYDTDLTKTYDRARITCQVVHYMKKFKDSSTAQMPTVIVGADEDQSFILLASNFYKYLDGDYNWNVAPSSAYKEDLELMKDLQDDANLSVYPFQFVGGNLDERYNSLLDLFDTIDSITQEDGEKTFKVKVSDSTIVGMFDEFINIAFKEPNKIEPVQAVNMFMHMLTSKNDDEYYFIPRNRNLYHLPNDQKVKVFGVKLEAYLNHYDRNFTSKEIDKLTGIADRLIEADTRRFKGDFWTPDVWAKRADEIMKESIGNDYKENSLVWDPAAGVRNLTRQWRYDDLYISAYHDSEILLGDGYNREAKATFQYDFLNDDVNLNTIDNPDISDWKMPEKLYNALLKAGKTNKRVIFYTNPPYGTANNVNADGTSKKGISKNKMNTIMINDGYGDASQQLYCQFFIRIMKMIDDFKLSNEYIAFFTKPRFFAGGKYFNNFNDRFFDRFEFVKGNLLNSGEFSDTASTWPITFSVYKLKSYDDVIPQTVEFNVEKSNLLADGKMNVIQQISHSMTKVYDSESLSSWVREPLQSISNASLPLGSYPQLSSALNESKGNSPRGRLLKNSLGYMVSNSNNIGEGTLNSGVWIVTGSAYKANGFNVLSENFEHAVVNFAARRAITPTWYNEQDNFHYPNMKDPRYKEFVGDSIVFSLFENASYQASYRDTGWSNSGVSGRWINEWFWLSKDFVREVVENHPKLSPIYDDLRGDEDRFVFQQINMIRNNNNLSLEAESVLNSATEVWKATLFNRPLLFEDYPEYHLQAWDAGWYQVKKINDKYPDINYSEFSKAFKQLKNKIEQNIYELEMLSK